MSAFIERYKGLGRAELEARCLAAEDARDVAEKERDVAKRDLAQALETLTAAQKRGSDLVKELRRVRYGIDQSE